MQRTNLYLDERQTKELDRIARAEGISRAAAVRRMIDRAVAAESADLEADIAAIEASFGVVSGGDQPHRAPDERAAHLDDIRRR